MRMAKFLHRRSCLDRILSLSHDEQQRCARTSYIFGATAYPAIDIFFDPLEASHSQIALESLTSVGTIGGVSGLLPKRERFVGRVSGSRVVCERSVSDL